MGRIKGIPVRLYEKNQIGVDRFNHPIYKEIAVDVENVLVAPLSTTEILEMQNMTGKKAVYTLAIPKGNRNDWNGNRVEFFGESWRVISLPQEGIKENMPLAWNQKWMVERYE